MLTAALRGLREKHEQRAREKKRAAAIERLTREHRFPILPILDEAPEVQADRKAVAGWIGAGTLSPFEALFIDAEMADSMLGTATKRHFFLWHLLFDGFGDDPTACDARLPPFESWYHAARTPLAAAAYARALFETAFAHRGHNSAEATEECQWAGYNARLDTGRGILGETLKDGPSCTMWLCATYDYALRDAETFEAFNGAFNAAFGRDMSNIAICRTHGMRLLPRWWGRDEADLERFARWAATMTQDRYGDGMYAMIYGQGYSIGGHRIGDTQADPDRIKRGYEDMVARFPCQSLLNRYAAGMYFTRDYATCADIFRTRLQAIVPEIWLGDTTEAQVADAMETFYVVQS